MRDLLNCPNCGAPIDGEKCQYCGTVFYDFAAIDTDKPSYIKMRVNGKLIMFKAILTNVQMTVSSPEAYTFFDNRPIVVNQRNEMTVSADFHVIDDDDGVLYRIRRKE